MLFALDVDVLHKEKGHNIRKVLSRFPLFMALTSKLLLFHNLSVRVYFVSNLNLNLLYIISSAWVLVCLPCCMLGKNGYKNTACMLDLTDISRTYLRRTEKKSS